MSPCSYDFPCKQQAIIQIIISIIRQVVIPARPVIYTSPALQQAGVYQTSSRFIHPWLIAADWCSKFWDGVISYVHVNSALCNVTLNSVRCITLLLQIHNINYYGGPGYQKYIQPIIILLQYYRSINTLWLQPPDVVG